MAPLIRNQNNRYSPNLRTSRAKNPEADTLSLGSASVLANGSLSLTSSLTILIHCDSQLNIMVMDISILIPSCSNKYEFTTGE